MASLGTEDHSLHFFDQSSLIENEKDYFVDINETSVLRGNHSVQVKKGFDGTNYVIDLMVGCPDEKNVVEYIFMCIHKLKKFFRHLLLALSLTPKLYLIKLKYKTKH